MKQFSLFLPLFLVSSLLLPACAGSPQETPAETPGAEAGSSGASGAGLGGAGGGASGQGSAGLSGAGQAGVGQGGAGQTTGGHAGSGAGGGSAGGAIDDGTPTRVACTSKLGSAITPSFGRLDGRLIALVPSSKKGCHADSGHLHLQVSVDGGVYDIAIALGSDKTTGSPEVSLLEHDAVLLDGPWQEGWHTAGVALDYPQMLAVHAGDFTPLPQATLEAKLITLLESINHVSVYATGYDDHTGAHLVHRNGGGHDGALVLHPTTGAPRYLLFHFATQSF